ncbi:MAG: right-handed parallel beta-helix repeat-containing protein [Kiritimatiellia bacterium]
MNIMQRALIILAGMAASAVSGADYYAALDGNDSASGTATNTAWRTLQTSVNRLNAGDTLWIREGTYRGKVSYTNKNGRVDAPIRIRSYPGEQVVLKGSVVATGWIGPSNGIWRLPGWNFNSQQVFVDGRRLTQLGWPNDWTRSVACGCSSWVYIPFGTDCRRIGATGMGFDFPELPGAMTAGTFWYEAASGTLYARPFGDEDLNTHLVEVSKDLGVFYDTSGTGCLQLEDLFFAHSSTFNATQGGWPLVSIGKNCLVRNCDISEGDAVGLSFLSNSRAENCRIADHGMIGVSMNYSTGWVIDSCVVSGNNYRQMNAEYGGGLKLIPDSAGTVQNCEVRDNFGTGIWFDTCNSGKPIIVRNNVVLRNSAAPGRNQDVSRNAAVGIFIEISSNADVYGNVISGNACTGIGVAGSRNVRVFNNTVHDTRGVASGGAPAAEAIVLYRGSTSFPLEKVEAYNNLIIDNVCRSDLAVPVSDGLLHRNLMTDYNFIYRTVPGGGISSTARAMFNSNFGYYYTLGSWQSAMGYDLHSLVAPPLLDASLRPLAGSPVIDAGTPDVPGWLGTEGRRGSDGDGDGSPRPDMGAYEWLAPGVRVIHVDAAGTNPVAPFTNLTFAATNLLEAIAVAAANDIVLVEPGLYEMDREMVLDRPVQVRGALRSSGSAVLAATATNRIARLDHAGALLENLTLRNGKADTGGGILLNQGRVQDCLVENCSANQGGGIRAATGTVVRATAITGCSAAGSGGALWLAGGALADSCTLTANSAGGEGGGAYLAAGAELRASTLRQNQASGGAGAALAGGSATTCFFDRNTASGEVRAPLRTPPARW